MLPSFSRPWANVWTMPPTIFFISSALTDGRRRRGGRGRAGVSIRVGRGDGDGRAAGEGEGGRTGEELGVLRARSRTKGSSRREGSQRWDPSRDPSRRADGTSGKGGRELLGPLALPARRTSPSEGCDPALRGPPGAEGGKRRGEGGGGSEAHLGEGGVHLGLVEVRQGRLVCVGLEEGGREGARRQRQGRRGGEAKSDDGVMVAERKEEKLLTEGTGTKGEGGRQPVVWPGVRGRGKREAEGAGEGRRGGRGPRSRKEGPRGRLLAWEERRGRGRTREKAGRGVSLGSAGVAWAAEGGLDMVWMGEGGEVGSVGRRG